MTEIRWREYAHASELAATLADTIGEWLSEPLKSESPDKQSSVTLALSGGKSPWPVYRELARRSLDWTRIVIVPTDERVAPVASPLSNFSSLQQCFGTTGARLLSLIPDASLDYRAAGQAADKLLAEVPWPPELVWLGMGMDGHTASIFPGANLREALDPPGGGARAVGVLPDPLPAEAPVARVTLTRAALVAARRLIVVINGAAKREIIERALAQGPAASAPIAQVLAAASRPVEIHWSPS